MIKPDIVKEVNSLSEFYDKLTAMQQTAHFTEYCAHHKPLKELTKKCDTVKELGVCQGVTLAAMMMEKPKKIIGIDIMPKYFNPYSKLFYDYAEKHNIDFEFKIANTMEAESVSDCDLLHIDTTHKGNVLAKELEMHGSSVKKYIVFHDTCNYAGSDGLLVEIAKFITKYQYWQIIDHNIQRVGYTIIKRVKRLPSHNERR